MLLLLIVFPAGTSSTVGHSASGINRIDRAGSLTGGFCPMDVDSLKPKFFSGLTFVHTTARIK